MSLLGTLLIESLFKVIKTKAFLYGIVVLVAFGLYTWNANRLENLQKANEQLERDKMILQMSLDEVNSNHNKIRKSLEVVLNERQKNLSEIENLKKTLYRENQKKKSLDELAFSKTKLVEGKINSATKHVITCIENLSKGLECKD